MVGLNADFAGLDSLFQAQARHSRGKDSEESSTCDGPKIKDVFMKGSLYLKQLTLPQDEHSGSRHSKQIKTFLCRFKAACEGCRTYYHSLLKVSCPGTTSTCLAQVPGNPSVPSSSACASPAPQKHFRTLTISLQKLCSPAVPRLYCCQEQAFPRHFPGAGSRWSRARGGAGPRAARDQAGPGTGHRATSPLRSPGFDLQHRVGFPVQKKRDGYFSSLGWLHVRV